MNKEQKEIIRTNRRYIKENVYNVNDVADKLYEYGILSLENKETIASRPVDRRAFELLDIVVKRGQRAFQGLIDALNDTENKEVADRLEGKSGGTTNTNYTNFSVSMVNKCGNSVTRSEESTKSADTAAPCEGPSIPGSQSQPPADNLNKPDVEWMNEVELTKLKENMTSTDPKFVLEMKKRHGENLYNLNLNKRGICLIIDNIPSDFCCVGECHHGMVDAGKTLIRQTMKLCGFKDVNFSRNTGTTKMIKEKILREMKKSSHSEYSSFFVICVTTGPNPGLIYGKDGESDHITIKELQEVMSQCKEFHNKPKVLLVHTVPNSSLQCVHSTSLAEGQNLTESIQHLSIEEEGLTPVNNRNMFVVSAELQPGISFLVRIKGKTGAYFSNALVYVLLKFAGSMSFLELISEMDKLLGLCEDEGLDNVDANPYNEKIHRSVRVAKLKVLTKPEKELYLFPLYEDTGTQVSS
ncbi:uncharacterized protein LOC134272984 [Saccostrea cucullata]|uniref:uncharacterized protein LOC134272984 n=1 Tax=Saccostrea cuccullata TaxID=36930 RepID=UPI002ED474D8